MDNSSYKSLMSQIDMNIPIEEVFIQRANNQNRQLLSGEELLKEVMKLLEELNRDTSK